MAAPRTMASSATTPDMFIKLDAGGTGQGLASLGQFMLPRIQLCTIGLLAQQTLRCFSAPARDGARGAGNPPSSPLFHVEQAPVDEPPTLLAAPSMSMATASVANVTHAMASQSRPGWRPGRHPGASQSPPACLSPARCGYRVRSQPFGEHVQRWLALADEAIAHAVAETRMGEQADRFWSRLVLRRPVGPGREERCGN